MWYKKLAILLFIISHVHGITYAATNYELRGKHAELAFECDACHGTSEPVKRAPASSCIECHDGYPGIGEITKGVEPNPHDSHQGEIRCTACHKVHEPSVLYCNSCHSFELEME